MKVQVSDLRFETIKSKAEKIEFYNKQDIDFQLSVLSDGYRYAVSKLNKSKGEDFDSQYAIIEELNRMILNLEQAYNLK